ncbi:hypothetical protein BU17DRAFT_78674 [Hysterangium stoloniferum]|nr:hypothetical protein BU17DRAFT_78674 [Hysterangium stoloniferum]
MKHSDITKSNASVILSNTRVLVVGGTQGIGQGVAERFAKANAEVWIVGRNAANADKVINTMTEISQSLKDVGAPREHRFFKADLSLTSEAKRIVEEVAAQAGTSGIDYMVMCQGGPSNGKFVVTQERHEEHYAVQVLSRFIMAYKLSMGTTPTVKKGIMSIMAPGMAEKNSDYEDLDLQKAKDSNKYGILSVLSRDSLVVDTFTEELGNRVPNVTFTHVFPGAVRTHFARNSNLPWYFILATDIILSMFGSSKESYAEIPFYLLANPEGQAMTAAVDGKFWDHKVQKIKPQPSLVLKENREKVWDHLMSTIA